MFAILFFFNHRAFFSIFIPFLPSRCLTDHDDDETNFQFRDRFLFHKKQEKRSQTSFDVVNDIDDCEEAAGAASGRVISFFVSADRSLITDSGSMT
jgi:hypothetical protein